MPFAKPQATVLERLESVKRKAPRAVAVDFETRAIQPRPDYPPEPVGVAIMEPGRMPEYLAWGHPVENNTTKEQARRRLKDLWLGDLPLVFHHATFELEVGEERFNLPPTPKAGFFCTEILAFIANPHADRLALKPLADELLGMAPDERDDLRAWILKNVPECRGKSKTWKSWGAFISRAPGDLVGRYARGDVVRTIKLFKLLWPWVVERAPRGLEQELKLVRPLIEMERTDTPVDLPLLEKDVVAWELWLNGADEWLRRKLRAPSLDVDSGDELADAIERAGFVKPGGWLVTAKGNRSTSKDSIDAAVSDEDVARLLRYRGRLATSLRTFGRPWLNTAQRTGGVVHFQWNQVRAEDSRGKSRGARTGRLSSQPASQNVPNEPPKVELHPSLDDLAGSLPYIRRYIKAPRGWRLVDRDYDQQELRILAHYEGTTLLEAYHKDPKLDVHSFAQNLVNKMLNRRFERKPIKNLGFAIIYGAGIKKTAEMMGVDLPTGKLVKEAYLAVLPGLKKLSEELIRRGISGESIETWGGRIYYVEPPKVKENGQTWSFEYKMLNTLIQGSAADCTKRAIVNWFDARNGGDERLLLTVHDEFLAVTPSGAARETSRSLREAMQAVEFELPMTSSGEVGMNWSEMKDEPRSWC